MSLQQRLRHILPAASSAGATSAAADATGGGVAGLAAGKANNGCAPSAAVRPPSKPFDYRRALAKANGDSDATSTSSNTMNGSGVAALPLGTRFLAECAQKLNMKPLTSATASVLYHRFFAEASADDYDAFLMAASCLYLAAKIKDDLVKIRDVINVTHATLNRGEQPLDLGEVYWSLRDGIVQAELLITRVLKFNLTVEHPHKYLLHYMVTLQEWFGKAQWQSMPIARIAAGFLQDFHGHPSIIDHKPAHVACCCLSLAFQTYGVQVPVTDEFDENLTWYNVFAKDLTKELHWDLLEKIMQVYDNEQDEKDLD